MSGAGPDGGGAVGTMDEDVGEGAEQGPDAEVSRRDALVSVWALVGVAGVFGWAVYRLGGRGVEAIRNGLDVLEWTVLVVLTLGFVYTEGIQTFDRRWIPKLFERARRLRKEAAVLQILAPLYGLSLVGTDWRELAKGWGGTLLIVLAVLIIRQLPPPWRGIVDFAVAAALAWGMVTILRRTPSVWRPAAGSS